MLEYGLLTERCQFEDGCKYPIPEIPPGPEGAALLLFEMFDNQFQYVSGFGVAPVSLLYDQFRGLAKDYGIPWNERTIRAIRFCERQFLSANARARDEQKSPAPDAPETVN